MSMTDQYLPEWEGLRDYYTSMDGDGSHALANASIRLVRALLADLEDLKVRYECNTALLHARTTLMNEYFGELATARQQLAEAQAKLTELERVQGVLVGALETVAERFEPIRHELIFSKRMAINKAIAALAAVQKSERCPHCDGTGDVHRADGEWLGGCDCGAAQKPAIPHSLTDHIEKLQRESRELVPQAYNTTPSASLSVALGNLVQEWSKVPGLLGVKKASQKPASLRDMTEADFDAVLDVGAQKPEGGDRG